MIYHVQTTRISDGFTITHILHGGEDVSDFAWGFGGQDSADDIIDHIVNDKKCIIRHGVAIERTYAEGDLCA